MLFLLRADIRSQPPKEDSNPRVALAPGLSWVVGMASRSASTSLRTILARTGFKGIDQEILDGAGVGVDDLGVVSLPYRSYDGEVLRMRYRRDDRSWWAPGEGIYLFGLDTLPPPGSAYPSYCALVITEGESDALAAREHFAFHEDEVAVEYFTVGCPGALAFDPAWRMIVEPFDCAYVVGDGDDAGFAFIWKVRQSVPWVRQVQCPPGRDLRDLLQRDGLDALLALLREADETARLWDAFFGAPDLTTAERWLRGGR